MASPHVAGVLALMTSRFPGCTPAQLREKLYTTARPLGSSDLFGAGLVDADRATR